MSKKALKRPDLPPSPQSGQGLALMSGFGVALGILAGLAIVAGPVDAQTRREPNILVPDGVIRYAPTIFPDRVVATPGQDAATGFSVAWRTDDSVDAPLLEVAIAVDGPAVDERMQVVAATRSLQTENGLAHHHRATIDGLQPDTAYVYRVQGNGTWSAWYQLRTGAGTDAPLTLLYFGDTQNQNLSLTSRTIRESLRYAPDVRVVLYAGDLVSGGDDVDDSEWGEWFDANGVLSSWVLTAPALGNHEYFEEFEDTPQERRVLGAHWPVTFALPDNGAPGVEQTTYWFDIQGVRVVVLDGTSGLDLGTAEVQAQWLERVLSDNPHRWAIALIHQPMFAPREGRDNDTIRDLFVPVLERHGVDLMLQGHDHVYGRRSGLTPGGISPQYIVSVAGPKQYLLSDEARASMTVVGEDTQLFQVIRVDGDVLAYEARTVTGRLYDAFEVRVDGSGRKQLVEIEEGRIEERRCGRTQTLSGRTDRCWE